MDLHIALQRSPCALEIKLKWCAHFQREPIEVSFRSKMYRNSMLIVTNAFWSIKYSKFSTWPAQQIKN